jgi:hypothetical protein
MYGGFITAPDDAGAHFGVAVLAQRRLLDRMRTRHHRVGCLGPADRSRRCGPVGNHRRRRRRPLGPGDRTGTQRRRDRHPRRFRQCPQLPTALRRRRAHLMRRRQGRHRLRGRDLRSSQRRRRGTQRYLRNDSVRRPGHRRRQPTSAQHHRLRRGRGRSLTLRLRNGLSGGCARKRRPAQTRPRP